MIDALKCWWEYGELALSYIASRNVKRQTTLESGLIVSLKGKNTCTKQFHSYFTQKKLKHMVIQRLMYEHLYELIHNIIAPNWKQLNCSSTSKWINNLCPNYGILLVSKKEWTTDMHNKMNEFQIHYANSIYINF